MAVWQHALSFDVEDWYHPELVRPYVSEASGSIISEATHEVLVLLERHGVRATFFIVGEVAARYPDLVREIHAAGHEVACHGMSHRPLWDLTPDSLRAELKAFANVVTPLVGENPVVGFRAPTFSLDNRTAWAINVLREFAYQYDSSIFPVRTPLYGVQDCPSGPYYLSSGDVTRAGQPGDFVEFPLPAFRWACLKVPVGGGFYLRAVPFGVLVSLLRRVAKKAPFVLYVHPWEMYREIPRETLSPLSRLVSYYNIEGATAKLEGLLRIFAFAPIREVLANYVPLRGMTT